MRKVTRRFRRIILPVIACAVTGVARADLTFNLRAVSVNGAALSGAQTPHSIPSVAAGDLIAFDVFALVTGTDANFTNDKLTLADGSFRSTTVSGGGPLGNLKMDIVRAELDDDGNIVTPGWDRAASSVGLQQDLDGDGDLDVGSNNDGNAANFWAVIHTSFPSGGNAGLPNGVKVGFGTFTVTSPVLGSTLIRFDGRNAVTASGFTQDGTFISTATMDSTLLDSILVSAIPEPTSMTIVGAGLTYLGWCRWRRPGRAH